MKKNLEALKLIRDDVEHNLLGKSDAKWLPLFQACCLNFDKVICQLFGNDLSLQNELSFALQFARLNVEQITELQKYEIPEHIEALDARLKEGLTEEQAVSELFTPWTALQKADPTFTSSIQDRPRQAKFTTSWSNLNPPTSYIPTSQPGLLRLLPNDLARSSRATIMSKRGASSVCGHQKARANRKPPTKIITSIMPRITTIRTQKNGSTFWLPKSRRMKGTQASVR
jgi:hypothetical protein